MNIDDTLGPVPCHPKPASRIHACPGGANLRRSTTRFGRHRKGLRCHRVRSLMCICSRTAQAKVVFVTVFCFVFSGQ